MRVHYTAALLVLLGLQSFGVTDALAGKRKRFNTHSLTEQAGVSTTGNVTPSTSPSTTGSHDPEMSNYRPGDMDGLISSIRRSNLKEVIEFIEKSPELLDQYDEDGWSPVHHAARSGEPLILEKFREKFRERYTEKFTEKFTEKTPAGHTPFILSLFGAKTALYLLSVLPKETPFLTDANGSTPLHISSIYRNYTMIGKLLDLYSVDQILQKNNLGQNFLHVFANAGGFQSGGIRVVEDRDYTTPLSLEDELNSNIPDDPSFSYLGEKDDPRITRKIFLRLFYEKDLNGKTPEDLRREYEPKYKPNRD